MYFSKPQDLNQNSFSIVRGRFEEDKRRKRNQDWNQIKINKSKLPSDFFKKSVERSLPRKSPLDSSSNRLSLPRTTVLRKYPQTQRKINSYHQLPESTQLDHKLDFTMAKTQNIRLQVQHRKGLNRKILLKQINTSEDQFQQIKMLRDYVKPKCIKRKQAGEILETNNELRNLIKQRFANKFSSEQFIGQSNHIHEEIDMGCTFGKGFRKQFNSSLQNSKVLKDQSENSTEFSNVNSSGYRDTAKNKLKKDSGEQKSTQQSEVYEGLKSNENSPLRAPQDNRLNFTVQQTSLSEHPKINKIQWNIYNQDLSLFQGLYPQKSKDVFTAQERQRKTKYRINNSSNNYRQKTVRKDKRLGEVNLPRINKVVNISGAGQL